MDYPSHPVKRKMDLPFSNLLFRCKYLLLWRRCCCCCCFYCSSGYIRENCILCVPIDITDGQDLNMVCVKSLLNGGWHTFKKLFYMWNNNRHLCVSTSCKIRIRMMICIVAKYSLLFSVVQSVSIIVVKWFVSSLEKMSNRQAKNSGKDMTLE